MVSKIAILIPIEAKRLATLLTINEVPFLLVPTNVTIFLSGVKRYDKSISS